jgi:hypothetical protein
LAAATYPRGYLFGLTLSNGTDATNDIDIAVGECTSDDAAEADRVPIANASVLTKRLDAAWSVGSAAGGLDTGVIANTTYHVFLITRVDTGVVDALFSASLTPTMPTSYTKKRRIGSILRESAAIVAFVQIGDTVLRNIPIADVNDDNPGTAAVTRTLSVPTGITVEAILFAMVYGYASGAARLLLTAALPAGQTDSSPTTGLTSVIQPASNGYGGGMVRVLTNTSAQIRSRLNASDATTFVEIGTHGWVDTRGRLA